MEQVPDNLGSKINSYEKTKLLNAKGDFAVFYKSSGAVILAKNYGKEISQYPNPANILVSQFSHPHLFTIHDNDVLQVLNIESKTCEKFVQSTESLKRTQALLLSDKEIYCITPNKVFIWQRSNMQSAPKELAFVDSKNPENRPIINVSDTFSKALSPDTLLLANLDEVQVWKIVKNGFLKKRE